MPSALSCMRAIAEDTLAAQEVDETQRQDLRNLAIVAHVGEWALRWGITAGFDMTLHETCVTLVTHRLTCRRDTKHVSRSLSYTRT